MSFIGSWSIGCRTYRYIYPCSVNYMCQAHSFSFDACTYMLLWPPITPTGEHSPSAEVSQSFFFCHIHLACPFLLAFLYVLREVFSIYWSRTSWNEKWKLSIIDCHPYFSHYLTLLYPCPFMSYEMHVPFVFISMSFRNLSLFSSTVVYLDCSNIRLMLQMLPLYWCSTVLHFLCACECVAVMLPAIFLIISNVSVYIHPFAIYHLVAVGISFFLFWNRTQFICTFLCENASSEHSTERAFNTHTKWKTNKNLMHTYILVEIFIHSHIPYSGMLWLAHSNRAASRYLQMIPHDV